jgi:ribosomal-protein-alanine N-acetyltransferase
MEGGEMNHQGSKRLETPRLILRRFESTDADAIFNNWASDPVVTKYLRWPAHQSIDVTKYVLAQWVNNTDKEFYQWAIVPKNVGVPIGTIGSVGLRNDISSINVGYCIGKAWWHQGYISEALLEVIRFFFEKVGANRVESQHDPRNENSGKVMSKCGIKYEGTLRQSDISNLGVVDAAYYAILAEDWRATR